MTETVKRSDMELLKAIQDGDDGALDTLLERYKEPVLQKAATMYLIGGERDDLIQEGMIGLLKAIRTYREEEGASFSTYAEICVTRKMYTAIEHSNRQKQIPLNSYVSLFQSQSPDSDVPLLEAIPARDGQSPEEMLIDRENVRRLEEKMHSHLSAFENQVLELMLTGLDYISIAQVLDKSPKQVDNAIQRMRKKLRA